MYTACSTLTLNYTSSVKSNPKIGIASNCIVDSLASVYGTPTIQIAPTRDYSLSWNPGSGINSSSQVYLPKGATSGVHSFKPTFNSRKIENIEKLDKMLSFKYNWNGNGALSFPRQHINFFRKIIEELNIQPQIAPTGRKSLLMQFELEDNSYLGFEVFYNKIVKLYIPHGDYDLASNENIDTEFIIRLNEIIKDFYGQE